MTNEKIKITPEIEAMIKNTIQKQNEILNRKPISYKELTETQITI